jgi:hypothetical protein
VSATKVRMEKTKKGVFVVKTKEKMKNLKIIAMFIVGIFFFMNLVSAADLGTFAQNDCVTLYQSCDDCTFVNLTSVKQPNQTQIIEQEMTNFGYDFTYEYCNTSQIGGYKYNVCGDKGGSIICEVIDFEITKTGAVLTEAESKFYFAILFTVLGLFAIFLAIFLITPYENKKENTRDGLAVTKITKAKYIKLVSLWIAYGFFIWFITIVSGMANNYIFFDGTRIMISNLSIFLNILSWGVNTAMVFFLIFLTWKDIVLNKEIIKNGKALLNKL